MSQHNIKIVHFGEKLDILLMTGKVAKTPAEFARRYGVSQDHLSRMRSGQRTVPRALMAKIEMDIGLSMAQWTSSVEDFANALGVKQEYKQEAGGFDFATRIRDRRAVEIIFRQIAGCWYSYYYSVSRFDKPLVSRDVLYVRRINNDGFIECDLQDGYFAYSGVLFSSGQHLYLFMEKTGIFNEIISYIVNVPDRFPPILSGIILCVSGGVEKQKIYAPSASRVTFRFVGPIGSDAEKNATPGYLDPASGSESHVDIFADIDNTILGSTVPFALQVR